MASDPEAVKQRRADNLRKAREAKERKANEKRQLNVPPAQDPEPKQRPPPPSLDEQKQDDYYSEPSFDEPMDHDLDDIDFDVSVSEEEEPIPKKKKQPRVPPKTKSKLKTKPITIDSPKKEKSQTTSRRGATKKRKREEEEESDSDEEEQSKQINKKSKKNEPTIFQRLYSKAENLDLSDEAINYLGTVVGILGVLLYIRNRPATGTVGKTGMIPNTPIHNLPPSPQETRGNYYTPAAEIGQPVLYR